MNQTVHTLSAVAAMMFLQQNKNIIDAETIKSASEGKLQLVPLSAIWRVQDPKNNEIANATSDYEIGEVPLNKGKFDTKEYAVVQGLSFAHVNDADTNSPTEIQFESGSPTDPLIKAGEISIVQKDATVLTISIDEIVQGMKNNVTPGIYVLGGLEKILVPDQTIVIRMSLPAVPSGGAGTSNFYKFGIHGFKTKV